MDIYQVDPATLRLHDTPSRRDVAYQKARLLREGQIQPFVIDPVTRLADLDQWAYADAEIVAARELGWATVLVTY